MLRISKLADYATLIMRYVASEQKSALSAQSISEALVLASPTVRKILKLLARAGLVQSCRGAMGGYQLASSASEISLLNIIEAIDGPIAFVDCADRGKGCYRQSCCNTREQWLQINSIVRDALAAATLKNFDRECALAVMTPALSEKPSTKEGV